MLKKLLEHLIINTKSCRILDTLNHTGESTRATLKPLIKVQYHFHHMDLFK